MKGKRYTTEEKIRLLREADRGDKSIRDICQEQNVSEVTFRRRKKQFGQMDLNEARRLKELERENGELKKMLADPPCVSDSFGGHCRNSALVQHENNQRVLLEILPGAGAVRFSSPESSVLRRISL